ncbi:MAG: DNA recombination protein RmuC [Eubacteriales bacterium]|nr:DNA recombination protein RmuC [Eubacteriales bacterium]HPF19209.1 DNA recombination protein RmuC [Bacillota bacterium]
MTENLAMAVTLGVAIILIMILLWMVSVFRRELRENRKELTSYMQMSFQTLHQTMTEGAMQNEQKLDNIRVTMENRLSFLQQDNHQQLERMRQTVDEKLQQTLEERISKSFESVRKSLEEVYRGLGEMQTLASGVGDLKKVLSNVKTRGILGEIQLGAILEQILSKEQYEENVCTRREGNERVEFAVKMPGDGGQTIWLPIDAKFHGDTYANLMNAYETGDQQAIVQTRRMLVDALRKSAKDIHDKYIDPPGTTDFAVLFLPFEGLYAEAVNLGAMETLQRENKVMVAGPATMAALLNSLQMGFKTLAIQKHSGQVWNILGAVKSEFDKFGDVLAATQQRLNQANEELDKLVGTRTRSIQRTLRSVQDLAGEIQREE